MNFEPYPPPSPIGRVPIVQDADTTATKCATASSTAVVLREQEGADELTGLTGAEFHARQAEMHEREAALVRSLGEDEEELELLLLLEEEEDEDILLTLLDIMQRQSISF